MPSQSHYSAEMAKAIVETIRQPFLILDTQLVVQQCNAAYLDSFQASREETDGNPVHRLGNGQWDVAELRRLLDDILRHQMPVKDYRVEHEFERIGRRAMLLNAMPIINDGHVSNILLAISDVTESERLHSELEGQKEFAEKVVDASRDALLILTWDLRVKAANQTFYRHFQVDPSETEGQLVYRLGNGQWDIPQLRELLEKILPQNDTFDDFEVEHDFEHIGRRFMLLNARKIDHQRLILLAIEDVTERKGHEAALLASEERLREVLETEAVGVLFFDPSGTLIDSNDVFLRLTGYSRADVDAGRLTWRDMTPPEWVHVSEEQMEKLATTGRLGPYEKEYLLKDGSRSWMMFAGRSLSNGTIVEFCIDVASRKQVEEERELLARELSHRVKNTLAVVQSLAMHSTEGAKTVKAYRDAFLGRLHALARAHSLMIDAQWQSAELKPLVEQATDAYRVDHPRRIEVEGPPITLSARKSLSLTLILHELGTNAAKYGALSRHEGRLCITWTVERDSESECVRLIWQERDGPEVESPQRRGFGSKLIDRAVESGLNGKAEIDYARPGLACAITFPVP